MFENVQMGLAYEGPGRVHPKGPKLAGLLSLHYPEKLPLRAVVGGEVLGYNLASKRISKYYTQLIDGDDKHGCGTAAGSKHDQT